MKKFFILIALILIVQRAQADIIPHYINSIRHFGIGFTRVKSPLIIKEEPSGSSKMLETVSFDYNNNVRCKVNKNNCDLEKIFSVYSNQRKLAFLTTLDETEGFVYVCYNDEKPLCGWVDDKNNTFYNWNSFFNVLGKKYGLYAFKDISDNDKLIFASPDRASNSLGSLEFPKYISPWLVQGNWVLAKIYDFNSKIKTGWLNFRGDDGKLRLFVKF